MVNLLVQLTPDVLSFAFRCRQHVELVGLLWDKIAYVGAHRPYVHAWDLGPFGMVMSDTCASGGRNDAASLQLNTTTSSEK
jgi:hypothetical protein